MKNHKKKAFKVGEIIYYDEQEAIKADKMQQEEIFKRNMPIVSIWRRDSLWCTSICFSLWER